MEILQVGGYAKVCTRKCNAIKWCGLATAEVVFVVFVMQVNGGGDVWNCREACQSVTE